MQTLPPSNQDVNGINWLPLKVLVACKLTNRFAWPDTDYRIKIADLNFPHYLPKAFEVHIEIVWLYLLFSANHLHEFNLPVRFGVKMVLD